MDCTNSNCKAVVKTFNKNDRHKGFCDICSDKHKERLVYQTKNRNFNRDQILKDKLNSFNEIKLLQTKATSSESEKTMRTCYI